MPSVAKVLLIVLENTNEPDARRQPYLQSLLARGAYLSNFHSITHPSQPNYLSLVTGRKVEVGTEKVDLDYRHLGNLLEESGKSWKTYAENYPGGCFLGEFADQELYARKHTPFVSFRDVQNDPARCARIVSGTEFHADLTAGRLPDFSLYIPNQINDGHNDGVERADLWLQGFLEPILADTALMKDLLVIVTFDEGVEAIENPGRNFAHHIYMVLLGAKVRKGAVSNQCYDHFSLLRTLEDTLGLGNLGEEDTRSPVIDDVWNPTGP